MPTGYNNKVKHSSLSGSAPSQALGHHHPITEQRARHEQRERIHGPSRVERVLPSTLLLCVSIAHTGGVAQHLTRLLDPPTARRCLPSQLLGASLLLCRTTVLLWRRMVKSYHAEVMSLFSRRRFSTSCWSSSYSFVSRVRCETNEDTYRALLCRLFLRGCQLFPQSIVCVLLLLEIL